MSFMPRARESRSTTSTSGAMRRTYSGRGSTSPVTRSTRVRLDRQRNQEFRRLRSRSRRLQEHVQHAYCGCRPAEAARQVPRAAEEPSRRRQARLLLGTGHPLLPAGMGERPPPPVHRPGRKAYLAKHPAAPPEEYHSLAASGRVRAAVKAADGRRFNAPVRRLTPAEFQPVERRLAGHRRAFLVTARLELAGQHRHHRIMAQFVMVVQVLVAERGGDDALPTSVVTSCSINPGLRASMKQRAKRPTSPIARSVSPSRSAPATFHRRNRPRRRAFQRVQNRTVAIYTLFASGNTSAQAKPLSQKHFP